MYKVSKAASVIDRKSMDKCNRALLQAFETKMHDPSRPLKLWEGKSHSVWVQAKPGRYQSGMLVTFRMRISWFVCAWLLGSWAIWAADPNVSNLMSAWTVARPSDLLLRWRLGLTRAWRTCWASSWRPTRGLRTIGRFLRAVAPLAIVDAWHFAILENDLTEWHDVRDSALYLIVWVEM